MRRNILVPASFKKFMSSDVWWMQCCRVCTSHYFCVNFKLSCDSRFQCAFTACVCVFKVNARWKQLSQLSIKQFEMSVIFWGSLGSCENRLEPKIETIISKFSLSKSVKRSVASDSAVWGQAYIQQRQSLKLKLCPIQ